MAGSDADQVDQAWLVSGGDEIGEESRRKTQAGVDSGVCVVVAKEGTVCTIDWGRIDIHFKG